MTANQIVATLEQKGCALWLEGGKVKFHDPERVITPGVLQALQKGREQVVAVIEGKSRPHLLHSTGHLAQLGRLVDLEGKVIEAMGYVWGQTVPGDWCMEQAIISAMYPESAETVLEILSALETHGRALCLRRYPAQRLWRIVPPKDTQVAVSGPVAGYGAQVADDFTSWELSV